MKIIGVTQRIVVSNHGEVRTQVDTRLFKFIFECGYLPIPIPYFNEKKKKSIKKLKVWTDKTNLNGIVLSGGEDVGIFKLRDFSENFLIKYSIKKKIPIFGICRGMQMIGGYFNVKLVKVKNHVRNNHYINFGERNYEVNSYHNYSLQRCPKSFIIESFSQDGKIESIIHKTRKIYAIMWHPERYKKFKKFDIKNFRNLFK